MAFDFQNYYQFKNSDLLLTILKSGDFRDDSGLYFTYGDFSFLTAVDSNDLNFSRHPENLTVYASNFAGGASGFPFCFDTLTETEKYDLAVKSRKARKAVVSGIVRAIEPSYYLPYAGFFKEKAIRDEYIRKNNLKNSVEDFYNITEKTLTLDVNDKDEFTFLNSTLESSRSIERNSDFLENPEEFMQRVFESSSVDNRYIEDYFLKSGFKDQLILYLTILENEKTANKVIVDFSKDEIEVSFRDYNWEEIKEKKIHSDGSIRALQLKVRKDSFHWVLENKKPWEELSIGFQCQIDRVPDVYNVDFWFHFTNIYI
jgi:CMP-N-acetylneuraminate monooxygenase